MNVTNAQAAMDTAKASSAQYDEFWRQDSAAAFGQWTLNGVAVTTNGSQVSVQLAPSTGAALTCSATDIDGGTASYNAAVGLCAGTDPLAPGSYDNGLNYYNGGSFYYGTLTSPVVTTKKPITTVIASWDATTPTGTWLEVHIRTLQSGAWTHWYKLPVWASDFSTIHRHSVAGQSDKTGSIDTDTYRTGRTSATAYQLSLTLFTTTPGTSLSLRRVTAIASYDNASSVQSVTPDQSVWGTNLAVPQRSQMLPEYQGLGYGGGGEVWCSPTSTSMVMAYWSNVLNNPDLNQTVPDAARDTYDFTYDGTGNWPFNTAYAASHGLRAFVTRMYSLSQIEQWIKVGVPIIISIAYKSGQLPGAPASSTAGHLMVVRGFAANGDVITNDPAAATNDEVQRVYPRAIFQSLWQTASNGTVYVIYPEFWPTPWQDALGSW